MKKRLLSLVLCLVMVFSLFPVFELPTLAVRGDVVAADGTYTGDWSGPASQFHGQKEYWAFGTHYHNAYFQPYVKATVTVSGGKITNVVLAGTQSNNQMIYYADWGTTHNSDAEADARSKALAAFNGSLNAAQVKNNGVDATLDGVNAAFDAHSYSDTQTYEAVRDAILSALTGAAAAAEATPTPTVPPTVPPTEEPTTEPTPEPTPTTTPVTDGEIWNPARVENEDRTLSLSKTLSQNESGSFDVTMESYATAELNTVNLVEKIPTDFVVIVDQSGSMEEEDMATGYTKYTANGGKRNLEDIPNDQYYYKVNDDYYAVYAKRGYLFQHFETNSKWTENIIQESGADLSWFQSEDDITEAAPLTDRYYYQTLDGVFHPVTVTVEGKVGTYYVRFKYRDSSNNWVPFTRSNTPYYKNLLGSDTSVYKPGDIGYGTVNSVVTGVYNAGEAYTYSTFGATTGMYINYPMYKRWVGYTELCYRDKDGVEHTVLTDNNVKSATYCNSSGQATIGMNSPDRMVYSNLYVKDGSYVSRLSALKKALTEFAGALANETDSNGIVDNRVAIVGFASEPNDYNYSNTELLTGTNLTISGNDGKQMRSAGTSDYKTALVGATNGTAGTVNTKITSAISAITANGGTQPEYGFQMAKSIFENRTDTTYTVKSGPHAGQNVPRNKIVIFFTDGHPGDYAYSDMYKEANDVVKAALQVKNLGASVFSIGVFGESDGNPLTYPNSRESSEKKDLEFLDGWMDTVYDRYTGYYYYMHRQWRTNSDTAYGANPNDTIADYMSVVSSNYPSAAGFCSDEWIAGTAPAGTTWLQDITAKRGTPADNGVNNHYRMASNQDTLVAAFEQAVTNTVTIENEQTIDLGGTQIFKDKVNLNDFDASQARYEIYYQPLQYVNGHIVKSGDLSDLQAFGTPVNGEVTYDQFDYSVNRVSAAHENGNMLVVKITGLLPKTFNQTIKSNADDTDYKAGIYPEDEDLPILSIDSPTLTLAGGEKTYVIDFGAPMTVATGATSANTYGRADRTSNNGAFSLKDGGKAVYQLNSGDLKGGSNLVYSGADTGLVYGTLVNVEDAAPAWTKVTAVPGSSVYFDDDFTTPINVGDGSGYNAQITSATSVTTNADKLDGNYTIQFHGSRIDVYCTTDATAAAVTARVKNNATQQYVKNLVVSNKFQDTAHGTLYNVPTISVDCGEVGDYTLELTVKGTANYRFDGVRIYDPVANENYTGEAASEANATFLKVREQLLPSTVIADINQYFKDKKAYDEAEDKTGMDVPVAPASASNIQGVMFYMDKGASEAGTDNNMKIAAEYGNYGPKNEIYLKKGEGISFSILNGPTDNMKAWIGLSAPEGGTSDVTVKVGNVDVTPDSDLTAVDMYYPLDGAQNDQTITIQNNGDSLIAITNVKITGSTKGDPGVAQVLSVSDAEPAASVLSADDGLPYLAVTAKQVESLNAPAQAEDPQPTADPEPTPTQPGFADVIRQLFSSFVNALFGSIARLFGN